METPICGDENSKPSWSLQNRPAPGRTCRRCSPPRRRSSPCFEQNLKSLLKENKNKAHWWYLVVLDYRKTTESLQNSSNVSEFCALHQTSGQQRHNCWASDHVVGSLHLVQIEGNKSEGLSKSHKGKHHCLEENVQSCSKHPKHQRNDSSN